jgi:hypothetical protein
MDHTVAHSLDAARGADPRLVGRDDWLRIEAAAGFLPAPVVQGFYLECRLGGGTAPVDWIVRVEKPGRDILAGRNPKLRLPESLRADPVWARVARFCAAWADDPLLRAGVEHLWLEFDLESGVLPPAGAVPRPSLFAAIDRGAAKEMDAGGWSLLLDRLVQHLGPEDPDAGRSARRAAVAGLPAGATIPYVGFMLARPVPAVRIYVTGGTPASIPARMQAMGWPGAPSGLAALLEPLNGLPGCAAPEISMAHLDVDREVLSRVGVEFRFARRPQLGGSLVEAPFLQRLVELGLCTGGKRDGLLAWPGHSVGTLPHELWRSVIARRVNCVKLVHQPGSPAEAKGYLLADWRPAPPRAARAGSARPSRGARPASIG